MTETYFFIFLAAIYACVLGSAAWFMARVERRMQWVTQIRAVAAGIAFFLKRGLRGMTHQMGQFPARIFFIARDTHDAARRHRNALLAVIVLLTLPALLVHWLAPDATEAYGDYSSIRDPVITALLEGERLAPPLPLPPEVFGSKEIEEERRQLVSASREWTALDAEFRQRLLIVYQLMERHGYRMALLEGYRSPERQATLARLGPQVTNAGPYQSYHQYGLAADSAFYRNGRIVISEKDPWAMEGYRLYGQYAESIGLVWGGRWQMMDFGHVELRKVSVKKLPK